MWVWLANWLTLRVFTAIGVSLLFLASVTLYGYIQVKADDTRRTKRKNSPEIDELTGIGLKAEAKFKALETQLGAYVDTLRVSLSDATQRAADFEDYYSRLAGFTTTGVLKYNRHLALKDANVAATGMVDTTTFLVRAKIRGTDELLVDRLQLIVNVETLQVDIDDKILELLVYPIYNAHRGRVVLYTMYLNDVTERIQATQDLERSNAELRRIVAESTRELRLSREDLRRSRDQYRRMYEAAPVGMYRTAIQDGAFLDANDSMARLLGYDSVDELLKHRSVDHFLNPSDRDGLG